MQNHKICYRYLVVSLIIGFAILSVAFDCLNQMQSDAKTFRHFQHTYLFKNTILNYLKHLFLLYIL